MILLDIYIFGVIFSIILHLVIFALLMKMKILTKEENLMFLLKSLGLCLIWPISMFYEFFIAKEIYKAFK